MALILKDRVKETTTTTGTGTLTLAGAVAGFQSFSVIGNGNTTYYTITDGTNWEVGIGTYTSSGTTLSRDTILESSNAGAAVNFGAGTKEVFVTYPAERSVIGSSNPLALPDPGTNGNVLTSNGTIWTSAAPASGSTLTISNQTGAYTVVAGDAGKIINCTSGTFTVSLTAAATLGSGFNCWVWNTGTGTITIDPNSTETIDGVSTLTLRQGEGTQIVCNGTNWDTGDKKTMRMYAENFENTSPRPSASGAYSIALGYNASASGVASIAYGYNAIASGAQSLALARGSTAGAGSSTAIGTNSSTNGAVTATGSGAMALGGSYASGNDSFAAAISTNSSSYGATGTSSVAVGSGARATGNYSISIGIAYQGGGPIASGPACIALGDSVTAAGTNSIAVGTQSSTSGFGKYAYASGIFAAAGDAQTGTFVLRRATTDATATVLTTDGTAPGSSDQIILPNNSALAFHGTIIARQQAAGGSNYAAWEIKGALIRDANAASTVLGANNINKLSASSGASAWTVALSADTTNGGLAITVTGAAATNIRWVASVHTSEVTYA